MDLLLNLRRKQPRWGPRTLLYSVQRTHPGIALPSASTLGELLLRMGMVTPPRRQRRHEAPFQASETIACKPNDRWTIDFKGHFSLRSGAICHPLTLRDAISRMVLRIDACERAHSELVLPLLEATFREHGMPLEMHSDTGAPFGSTGLARLSPVSVYLLKLGIRPVYSRPGKPQDNGAHERMHLDLKAETTRPPGRNMSHQQEMFDAFRECFNVERPHHALGGDSPASRWVRSSRDYPRRLESPTYPNHWQTRRVDSSGKISWCNQQVLISSALRHEPIGIETLDEGLWRLHFASLSIGVMQTLGRSKELRLMGVNRGPSTEMRSFPSGH